MPHYNLALIGFGNVGQALAKLLKRKQAELEEKYDLTYSVVAIATGSHGAAIDPIGLDIERALAILEEGERLDELSPNPAPTETLDFLGECGADVVFESTPVDYQSGQPAIDYLRAALENEMHAISANKGPVVHAYRELTQLAERNGLKYYFEAAVMDGAPIFSLFREALPGANLRSFRGVLNSTTNLILTRMESGESFDQAVAYAQSMGVAETDPSGDIDGWDAAVKVAALAAVLMDAPLKPDQVAREGIRGITQEDITQAQAEGKRWKLVCSAVREGDGVKGEVAPKMVAADTPLYTLEGTTSLVQFETDVLSQLSIVEGNPGPDTTAYGMLADFLNAVRG